MHVSRSLPPVLALAAFLKLRLHFPQLFRHSLPNMPELLHILKERINLTDKYLQRADGPKVTT